MPIEKCIGLFAGIIGIKRLQERKQNDILNKLLEAVISSDKDRGKKHQVFERSFDCKPITTQHFFLEKLNCIHNNPCSDVWKLVDNPVGYKHSSAKQYIAGEEGEYPLPWFVAHETAFF